MTPFNKLERTDISVEPNASISPEGQAIRLPKTSFSRPVHLHHLTSLSKGFEPDFLNFVIFVVTPTQRTASVV
jgi:hypothetical protein